MSGINFGESLFVFDLATCNNYFEWFFEYDLDNKEKRDILNKTHIESAKYKATEERPTIVINNIISEILVKNYEKERPFVLDTFMEALEIRQLSDDIGIDQSIIKLASIYNITNQKVYFIISDVALRSKLKDIGIENVLSLSELHDLNIETTNPSTPSQSTQQQHHSNS